MPARGNLKGAPSNSRAPLALCALLLASCPAGDDGHGDPPPSPDAIRAAGSILAEVELGGPGQGVAVAGGYVWAGLHHGGGVAQVDPETNEIVERIQTGDRPGSLTAGGGAVWVANYGSGAESVSLSRIDPLTGKVNASVAGPDLPDLCCDPAIGDGRVWVPSGTAGALVGLDARSGEVSLRHQLDVEAVEGLTVAAGLVWIGDGGGKEANVLAVDPRTGSIVHQVPIGNSATPSATDGKLVWGLTVDEVFAIDPASGEVVERIDVDVFQGVIAVGEGSVWVAGRLGDSGVLYRVAPDKDAVVGKLVLGETPSRIAVGEGSVWITDFDAGKLYRVAPA